MKVPARAKVSQGSARTERAMAVAGKESIAPGKGSQQAVCRFLTNDLEETDDPPILLGETPVSWGKSRDQVMSGLMMMRWLMYTASIAQNDTGAFVLTDNRTELGTWVNYQPVPPEGKVLQSGDLIPGG